MRRGLVSWGVAVAVLATAANLVHGSAHAGQHVVSLPVWQWVYVAAVVYLAPICAALLLTRSRRGGVWLLLLSMAGTFGFDLVYHFFLPGPDNVSTLAPEAWQTPFVLSAVLVTLLGGLGAVVGGILLLNSLRYPAAGAGSGLHPVASRPATPTRPR